LVRFDETTVTSPFGSGSFGVDGGAYVGSMFIDLDYVRLGDTFENILGVVYFQDGVYKVQPRTEADLVGYSDTCGTCEADKCIGDLGEGDVVITELMVDPSATTDRVGEYVEVQNTTGGSIDLNCLALQDGSEHVGYVEENLVLAAGGIAVLTRRSDDGSPYVDAVAAAGALTTDYRNAVSLNNDAETISLGYGELVFDTVSYDATWPYSAGTAMELSAEYSGAAAGTANDTAAAWCAATSEIAGVGDLGTPGTHATFCSGTIID
jgi:hypothetical protein